MSELTIARGGPIAQQVRRRLMRAVFERGLDVTDTYGDEELEDDGLAHPERISYGASGWLYLLRALRREHITPADAFIDYGAGKGRIVLQAARYPFGRVIGLEISERLAAVAERSISCNRERFTCPRVQVVCADVLDFSVPDDITYAYFYNPFVGDLFQAALDGLIDSLDRRPRELTLIYTNPVMAAAVESSGRFRAVRRLRGLRDDPNRRLVVYKSLPGSPAAAGAV
ncbi:MAG: hypothetical protein QOG42_778 [Solirubrobacteraceae bacterium]|jgi:hypothetical protein|nr:hypothetical protein [Solirubrobacteraceae bacterium]